MKKYNLPHFGAIALVLFAVSLLTAIGLSGYNRYTGEVSFTDGFDSLASVFGGIRSFGALIASIVVAALAVVVVYYVVDHHFEKMITKILAILALIVLVPTLVNVSRDQLDMPSSLGWVMLGYIMTVLGAAALLTAIVNRTNDNPRLGA